MNTAKLFLSLILVFSGILIGSHITNKNCIKDEWISQCVVQSAGLCNMREALLNLLGEGYMDVKTCLLANYGDSQHFTWEDVEKIITWEDVKELWI